MSRRAGAIAQRPEGRPGSRRQGALALFLAGALPAIVVLGGARPQAAYREGPPPGFTGGFGEESCGGCHFGGSLNDSSGAFRLSGIPDKYEAGKSYPLVISVSRPEMEAGGFQLSARFREDGSQAGSLAPDPSDAPRLELIKDRDVQYIHQRYAGSDPGPSDSLRWSVVWTAPEAASAVVFHAAANAANGDGSASGDYIYTAEVVSAPP